VPEAPLWVGSGLGPHNAAAILRWTDGAIVGSALHRDGVAGRGIDLERVVRLTEGVWRSPGGR
jgi:predicted TIM-barrel enzyme